MTAPIAANTGVSTQNPMMRYSLLHTMASGPLLTIPNPMRAPTMDWVVETGSWYFVAKYSHAAAVRGQMGSIVYVVYMRHFVDTDVRKECR